MRQRHTRYCLHGKGIQCEQCTHGLWRVSFCFSGCKWQTCMDHACIALVGVSWARTKSSLHRCRGAGLSGLAPSWP